MSPKTIIFSLIGFFILLSGLIFIFSPRQKLEADRPKAETPLTFFNLGEMRVSDVKQQDFNLTNAGTKPLKILNINSSCDCTFGQIIYKDLTSKEYGMHAQSGYVTEIAPGDTATVRLTYKPAIMPAYGLVTREVYVTTNDPAKQKLIFSVKAMVKK